MADGSIYSAGEDSIIKKWNTYTGNHIKSYHGHENAVRSIVIHEDGDIISAGDDLKIR